MAGNTIKKANLPVEYTPQSLVELEQCSKDPIHFIKNYCKIEHPVRGIIPFKLYAYQEDLIKSFMENRFTLALCSRQLGKCILGNTDILIYKKPIGIKRWVLKKFYKREYNEIFSK